MENEYEAKLWLGLDGKNRSIIGTLNGVPIQPVPLRPVLEALETTTALKFDPTLRSLVFENERSIKGVGSPDYVTSREILSGAILPEIGGVSGFVDGGLASVNLDGNGEQQLSFGVPTPIQTGEVPTGFLTYVENVEAGESHYRRIAPDTGASADTILIGHPNGGIEFASPITSPVTIALTDLINDTGIFNGAPSTSGIGSTWKYQEMGLSQVITNGSGSSVEVELSFRISIVGSGAHLGTWCQLIDGGTDYKKTFTDGKSLVKTETGNGGQVTHTVVLAPNQRVQFRFGVWSDTTGNIVANVGSVDEGGPTVTLPVITTRRQV